MSGHYSFPVEIRKELKGLPLKLRTDFNFNRERVYHIEGRDCVFHSTNPLEVFIWIEAYKAGRSDLARTIALIGIDGLSDRRRVS